MNAMGKLILTCLLLFVLCPICREFGIKSRVYQEVCSRTLLNAYIWFDEDGKQHFHDPIEWAKNINPNATFESLKFSNVVED
jgi:hypothetical protein